MTASDTARELVERLRADTVKVSHGMALRREAADLIEQQARDIQAYRGALGYPVPGEYSDRLSSGEQPMNGIAEAQAREIEGLRKELDGLREIAAHPLAIQKVHDELGPLSLWSQSGLEREIARRVDAAMREGK